MERFSHTLDSGSAVSGVSTVSGVSLFQVCAVFSPNTAHVARYFFGIVEFMLMLVGGVDAVAGGHLGSWMILFLFVFLFVGRRRGCELSWGCKYKL
jgi:hypothetical protein